jgi:hypothetical protein
MKPRIPPSILQQSLELHQDVVMHWMLTVSSKDIGSAAPLADLHW